MSKTSPFFIGKGAGVGAGGGLGHGREGPKSSVELNAPSPAEHTVVTVDFRNSRRDGFHIRTSIQDAILQKIVSRSQYRSEENLEAQSQRNLFKSILASHFSVDFNVSSQVTSRPAYAAVRATMQESADSAPLSA